MDILVGSTGFVGSNLAQKHTFSREFHSTNIQEAYGLKPDLLVYAGVRAEKYLANSNPEADRAVILAAFENIRKIEARQVVLISTVDVYGVPAGVDEESVIVPEQSTAYGRNRLFLEEQLRAYSAQAVIIRLPGLYGKKIKKNFIYDLIHPIPRMLSEQKYRQLCGLSPLITASYTLKPNGFAERIDTEVDEKTLEMEFRRLGFTALSFTDSRAVYQFFNLSLLWDAVKTILDHDIKLINLAVEQTSAAEVYETLYGKTFSNEFLPHPPVYDMHTRHASLFGRDDAYILSKSFILDDIKRFVRAETGAEG